MARISYWFSGAAIGLLLAITVWVLAFPSAGVDDLSLRSVLADEQMAQWAILGVLGAILGNVLLFVNLHIAAGATKAANIAAEAARDAVDHARQTSSLELRPYLIIEELEPEITSFVSGKWLLRHRMRVSNIGRTPARVVQMAVGHAHLSSAEAFEQSRVTHLTFPHMGEWVDIGELAPSEERIIAWWPQIEDSLVQKAGRNEAVLIHYGAVEYAGLDPSQMHRVERSAYLVPALDDEGAQLTNCRFTLLDRFNGSDEYCTYRPQHRTVRTGPTALQPAA